MVGPEVTRSNRLCDIKLPSVERYLQCEVSDDRTLYVMRGYL